MKTISLCCTKAYLSISPSSPENEVDVETLPLLSESIITSFIPKIGPRLKFLAGWRAEVGPTCSTISHYG